MKIKLQINKKDLLLLFIKIKSTLSSKLKRMTINDRMVAKILDKITWVKIKFKVTCYRKLFY